MNGEIIIFGVNGANTASPWDSNPPNEVAGTGSPAACTMTTSNANDLLITQIGNGGFPVYTVPSGFSQITPAVGSGFMGMAAYDVVSSVQSSVSESWTFTAGTSSPEVLCDAMVSATVSQPVTLTVGEAGAPTSNNFVLSGCDQTPNPLHGDGASHTTTADASCNFVITVPPDGLGAWAETYDYACTSACGTTGVGRDEPSGAILLHLQFVHRLRGR